MIALLVLLIPLSVQSAQLLCQVCTDCDSPSSHIFAAKCQEGMACFTLRRAHDKVVDRGCGHTCSPEERASTKGDHCHMCDYDECNAMTQKVVKVSSDAYIEKELLPIPLDDGTVDESSDSYIERELLPLPVDESSPIFPLPLPILPHDQIMRLNGTQIHDSQNGKLKDESIPFAENEVLPLPEHDQDVDEEDELDDEEDTPRNASELEEAMREVDTLKVDNQAAEEKRMNELKTHSKLLADETEDLKWEAMAQFVQNGYSNQGTTTRSPKKHGKPSSSTIIPVFSSISVLFVANFLFHFR